MGMDPAENKYGPTVDVQVNNSIEEKQVYCAKK
jgi:hypothetical protein